MFHFPSFFSAIRTKIGQVLGRTDADSQKEEGRQSSEMDPTQEQQEQQQQQEEQHQAPPSPVSHVPSNSQMSLLAQQLVQQQHAQQPAPAPSALPDAGIPQQPVGGLQQQQQPPLQQQQQQQQPPAAVPHDAGAAAAAVAAAAAAASQQLYSAEQQQQLMQQVGASFSLGADFYRCFCFFGRQKGWAPARQLRGLVGKVSRVRWEGV